MLECHKYVAGRMSDYRCFSMSILFLRYCSCIALEIPLTHISRTSKCVSMSNIQLSASIIDSGAPHGPKVSQKYPAPIFFLSCS
jgi:hypothetical protein